MDSNKGRTPTKVGGAGQKIDIKPLKETNLGVVRVLFDP